MCGIAGVWYPAGAPHDALVDLTRRMGAAIAHRGPDGGGSYIEHASGIAIVHQRLSIVDLSSNGAQPMASSRGNLIITFNGEIYNHEELRRSIGPGVHWRSRSDTETLLELIARAGVDSALSQCRGMFAFALWNRSSRTLTLARDRVGEKPLYYFHTPSRMAFGSELKAITCIDRFPALVDEAAQFLFFRRGYIPAPLSVWRDTHKVRPGEIVEFQFRGHRIDLVKREYWSLAKVLASSREIQYSSESEADEAVEDALSLAVREQLTADVPVGAFLSSGVDSSLIVKFAAQASSQALSTFTVGHFDPARDERDSAREFARRLGTVHRDMVVTSEMALKLIPDLPFVYDEPLADTSALPTLIVSRLARNSVKVVLTGDGGDEFFVGYQSYLGDDWLPRWQRALRLPKAVRRSAARLLSGVTPRLAQLVARALGRSAGIHLRRPVAVQCDLVGALLNCDSVGEYWRTRYARWRRPPMRCHYSYGLTGIETVQMLEGFGTIRMMMAIDATEVLPGDLLVKVDRAAMSVGLETRAPMLDPRVIAAAARVPCALNIASGAGKQVLRRILRRHAGHLHANIPKKGFTVPMRDWLRGPLRDWASDLLSPNSLAMSPEIERAPVLACWNAHLAGEYDGTSALWTVLTWQAWRRSCIANP